MAAAWWWLQKPIAHLLPGVALGLLTAFAYPQPQLSEMSPENWMQNCEMIVEEHLQDKFVGLQAIGTSGSLFFLAETPSGYSPMPGDRLRLNLNLSAAPPALYPGGFNYQRYLERRGYAGLVRVNDWELETAGASSSRAFLWNWRRQVKARIRERLGASSGWALGILFGDRSDLKREEYDSFQLTGLGHILAVSGLHVGIVAWLATALFYFLPWYAHRVAIMIMVFSYALLVGFRASVVRATIMLLALLLPAFFSRPAKPVHALSLAAFLVLAMAPLELFMPGFQMSFIITFFLVWTIHNFPRLLRTRWGIVIIALVAQLAAAPLMVKYFHFFSPAAILLNVVLLPTFPWLLVWVFIAVASPSTLVAEMSAKLFAWQLAGMQGLTHTVEKSSFSHFNLTPPPSWGIGLFYLLLLLFIWRGTTRRCRLIVLVAVMTLCALYVVGKDQPVLDILVLRRGTGVIVRDENYVGLIDNSTARSYTDLLPHLRSRGINWLDWLVLAKPERRVKEKIDWLTAEVEIRRIISGTGFSEGIFGGTRSLPENVIVSVGQKWKLNDTVQVLHLSGKTNSLGVLATCFLWRGQRVLFTGPLTAYQLEQLLKAVKLQSIDGLITPHMRNNRETWAALLEQTEPGWVILTTDSRPLLPRSLSIDWYSNSQNGRISLDLSSHRPYVADQPPYPW